VLAAIPYTTFPTIELGPLSLRTFGLMVGIGVLLGAWVAARYIERFAGIHRDETYRMATRLVVAGIIGARITWDLTHWDEIDSPLDLIAVWQGGLQFSGGFLAAIVVGFPTFRRWAGKRWIALDGYAYGLTIGLAIGRIGCYSVGEHFGSTSGFFLATRYEGGDVREPTLGSRPLFEGVTFHHTALYELLFLLALFVILSAIVRRNPPPSTLMGVFCVYYGVTRFFTDALRVNDDTVLGLTGAQWMCVGLVVVGAWILRTVVPRMREVRSEAEGGEPAGSTSPAPEPP
jgi:phosphatidylglycerol:prolipoprotein diacylglycerol transferase